MKRFTANSLYALALILNGFVMPALIAQQSTASRPNINELIRNSRQMRELIWQDAQRPRYHLMPPEGFFNDANGALFWNGRYHMFYLARTPIPHPQKPGEEMWVAVWDHVFEKS